MTIDICHWKSKSYVVCNCQKVPYILCMAFLPVVNISEMWTLMLWVQCGVVTKRGQYICFNNPKELLKRAFQTRSPSRQ
jgi:hypothetical protein